MNTFKVVQIGCGGRAQVHASAIAQVKRLDFVATCDLIEKKAKKTASTHDVPRTYTDFREMIETESPDVVALITLPTIRSQVVLPVLGYKPKALVIEKPMAITLSEAEEMVDKADEVGTCFVISHQCRYSEEMVKLRELIKNGKLGKIEKIIVNCKSNLMDQGTHILDLIKMMLPEQEPRWVMAQIDGTSQLYARGGGTCDHAILQIGYDDGVTALASIGNRSPDVPENINTTYIQFQVSAIGSDGYGEATLGYGLDAFFSEGPAERSRFPGFDANAHMTKALYEEVVDVLEGNKDEHQASAHGALKVQRIINTVYESSLQGRAIRLPYRPLHGTLARIRHRVAASRPVVASTLMYGHYSRKELLREIASAGLQHVDLWMHPEMANHFDPKKEEVSAIKAELQKLGLEVKMISYYGAAPVSQKLRIAHELGAKVVVTVGVNVSKSPDIAEKLKPHLDLAQELGITIAFENHRDLMETIEDTQKFLDTLSHPAASICLAPPHLESCGQHPEDALAALKNRISVVYLWDWNVYGKHFGFSNRDAQIGFSNGDAQTPGTGNLDFRSIMTAAIRYAPQALWSFAWHGTEDWPIERITNGLIRASRHIDRCRPLQPDSVFLR